MEIIRLNSTLNTRDLGGTLTSNGFRVKHNRLIRSDKLSKLDKHDIETLKEHNLVKVIDFRSVTEFETKADVRIDGVEYINLPTFYKDIKTTKLAKHGDSNLLQLVNKETGGKNLLLTTYHDLVTSEKAIEAYRNFFKIVLDNKEGAILWHCSQGKDRAGLAAFYLLYALGVPVEECRKDYFASSEGMKVKTKEMIEIVLEETNDPSLIPMVEEVFMPLDEYIDMALNTINENYESLDNYLRNVLNLDFEKLQEMYLEK